MNFNEGDLHIENRELREYNASLLDKIDHLKDVNGELCEEINRQERRIRELEDGLNYVADKWAAAQVKAEDASKRCMLLEALVRDLAPFVCADDGIDEIERRLRELGIEVR